MEDLEKIVVFLLLALTAFALLLLVATFAFFITPVPEQSVPISQNPAPVVLPDPVPEISPLWDSIQLSVVELTCLSQAKLYAEDLAWAVNSCSCIETVSDSSKEYSCSVSALDGIHPVEISCKKESSKCVIESEEGTKVMGFAELNALVEN